jgi:hypothetical protein
MGVRVTKFLSDGFKPLYLDDIVRATGCTVAVETNVSERQVMRAQA